MMVLKGLFVWALGSVIRVIQLTSTLRKQLVSYLLITWIMTHWIQRNSRILTITRITWITRFLFISCLDQFYVYFPKSSVSGIARKQVIKIRNLYTQSNIQAACVNGCSNQLLIVLISWITKVHLFVYQFLALLELAGQ